MISWNFPSPYYFKYIGRDHKRGRSNNALPWHFIEPPTIHAIVIHQVPSTNPLELVALVPIEPTHPRLIPPKLPYSSTLTTTNIICLRTQLTSINLKASKSWDKWGMAPIGLHPPSLCGPVVCIPHRALDPHGLGFRVWCTIFFLVCKYPNWDFIHKKSE